LARTAGRNRRKKSTPKKPTRVAYVNFFLLADFQRYLLVQPRGVKTSLSPSAPQKNSRYHRYASVISSIQSCIVSLCITTSFFFACLRTGRAFWQSSSQRQTSFEFDKWSGKDVLFVVSFDFSTIYRVLTLKNHDKVLLGRVVVARNIDEEEIEREITQPSKWKW
jgi:ABC-type multidrug transport system permease subunit